MNITKYYLTIALSLVAFLSKAQERTDTVQANQLDEVVVRAQMQRTSSTKSTYTPTGKQKNAAQNAVDLLRQMAIPLITHSVTARKFSVAMKSASNLERLLQF